MTHQNKFEWWFVYGAPRTGSSYMIKAIGIAAKTIISDWEVGNLYSMIGPGNKKEKRPGIKFDWDDAFRTTSANLLENGAKGSGDQLDLAFKQAGSEIVRESYTSLVRMWGLPQRKIFCYRNPSSYIHSAIKKFPDVTLERLQQMYISSFRVHELIGGKVFEYHPNLTQADYIDFLSPLTIADKISPFEYTGADSPKFTSDMQAIFEDFRQSHSG